MGVAAVLLALGPAVPAEAGAEAVIELTVQKTMPGGVVGVHGTGFVGLCTYGWVTFQIDARTDSDVHVGELDSVDTELALPEDQTPGEYAVVATCTQIVEFAGRRVSVAALASAPLLVEERRLDLPDRPVAGETATITAVGVPATCGSTSRFEVGGVRPGAGTAVPRADRLIDISWVVPLPAGQAGTEAVRWSCGDRVLTATLAVVLPTPPPTTPPSTPPSTPPTRPPTTPPTTPATAPPTSVPPTTTAPTTTAPTTPTSSDPSGTEPPLATGQPPGDGGWGQLDRPSMSSTLARPEDVSLTLPALGRSLLLTALLLVLVGFPAERVNVTLERHRDRIEAWWRWRAGALRRAVPATARGLLRSPTRRLAAMLMAAAAAAVLVNDHPPAAPLALPLFLLAAAVAFGVTAIALEVPAEAHLRRAVRGHALLDAMPAALATAVACTLASRLLGFEPGYVYGLVAGYAVLQQRPKVPREEARAIRYGVVGLVVVSLLAWVAWGQLAGTRETESPARYVLDVLLAAVFLSGIEGLLFQLTPVRDFDGRVLLRAGWRSWAAVYAVPLFLFVHVVLPARAEGQADGLPPVQIEALALFVAFAAGSYAFAAWFHWAPEPAAARRGGRGAG